jgi:hypothetical protein
MSGDGVIFLRQLVTECKDVFRLKLDADPLASVGDFQTLDSVAEGSWIVI